MGEEMKETKGTGGREKKEGLPWRNSFHFPMEWSLLLFFFFFIHPCKSKDHLKSTHGHVHPPLHTKSPPHLFESYDIHAGWVYIYIYIYVRVSVGRGMGVEEIAGHPWSIERRSTLCPPPHPQSVTRQTQDDADRVFIPGFRRGGLVTTFNPWFLFEPHRLHL